jgi:hypothetical protein
MRGNKLKNSNAKNILFLQWWLLQLLIFIIGVVCYKLGLFHEIWRKDSSYLCFVIMLLYLGVAVFNGCLCAKQKYTERDLEIGWFVSELCLSLGMIGTVVGFIQMLSGFAILDGVGTKSIQNLIVNMSYGMSTALYTTLVGLIFGNIIKLQCFKMDLSKQEKDENEIKA